ncbi:hypothetical protein HZ992_16720 [Rhizobacter sp. AJA081-3]|uniref:hypothetical protein n=1 Tax=Rhizobacter sp. AJA081-3 TaxID=2753607 RepID=UPI001AE06278|nr:hypothetical protein [Rhizobacter sp. AJA081-3]QTN21806.1 hypothetical protein HZ992_16720 [Rhizobacter sp. AJA081-3]
MALQAADLSEALRDVRHDVLARGPKSVDPLLTQALHAAFALPSAHSGLLHWPSAAAPDPAEQLMMAASHLLIRVWSGHAEKRPACYRVLGAFGRPMGAGAQFAELGEVAHAASLDQLSPEIVCQSLIDRLTAGQGAAKDFESLGLPDAPQEYVAFVDLLRKTDARRPYSPRLIEGVGPLPPVPEEKTPAPTTRRWGNRGSQQLRDRELLAEWTYGLNALEASALAASFSASPAPAADRIVLKADMLAAAGGLLAQVGALTASTMTEAALLPVSVRSDGISSEPSAARPGGRQFVIERRDPRRGDTVLWAPKQAAGVALWLEVEDLDLHLHPFQRDFVIDELLPLPIDEIWLQVLEHLGERLGRSSHQVDLCVKHILARQIFLSTANRAIVTHLCSTRPTGKTADDESEPDELNVGEGVDQDDDSEISDENDAAGSADDQTLQEDDEELEVRRESLSHYVHPRCAAVRHAYRMAVHAIRYPEVPHPQASAKPREAIEGDTWVDATRMAAVLDWLAERAIDRKGKPAYRHSNDFMLYAGALVVTAIGHRNARALLPFLHDVSLDDAIAFVADKINVGSEARFVPLVKPVVEQLRWCRAHIAWLIAALARSNPAHADRLRTALGFLQPQKGADAVQQVGLLFRIGTRRVVPLSTRLVQWAIRRAWKALQFDGPAPFDIRALRRNVATWLADDGVSGAHIELLLGHVREQHPFGAASVWIPAVELKRLQEPLERYLVEMGGKAIAAPWAKDYLGRLNAPLPSLVSSNQAYEARKLETDEANRRARRTVLEVVPESMLLDGTCVDLNDADLKRIENGIRDRYGGEPAVVEAVITQLEVLKQEWRTEAGYAAPRSELLKPAGPTNVHFSVDGQFNAELDAIRRVATRVLKKSQLRGRRVLLLDDETVRKLMDGIEDELRDDPRAKARVRTAFAELATGWRRSGKYRVTAASLNLARISEGPVELNFGRHLALANCVADGLEDQIKNYLREERTAQRVLGLIAVLLVCCEAVLDRQELERLIMVLQTEGPARFAGQLQLRASIETMAAEYDRTVDLTYKTAAAVAGYLGVRQETGPVAFEKVEAEARRFLAQMTALRGSMNLRKLLVVMRPYWFLRVPGSVYASITGANECNAPSPESTALLLGAEPRVLRAAPPSPRGPRKHRDADIKAAVAAIRRLVDEAEGEVTKFQAASRQQRMRLHRMFSGRHRPELEAWMQRQQIVALAVEFIYYMLAIGGFRVDTYSFGSLQTYRQRIVAHILEVAWNVDLLQCDEEALAAFFRAVIARVAEAEQQAAKAPLRLFLRYLHEWHGMQNSRFDAHTESRLRNARNVVLPTHIVERAFNLARTPDGKATEVGETGAALLALNQAYGLRPAEGYGVKVTDFQDDERTSLRVRINVIRSLKTLPRTIPVSLASEAANELINTRYRAADKLGGQAKYALFAAGADLLYDDAPLYALGNWAVKRASGDHFAINYSMRHTYATSMMSHMLMPDPQASPIAVQLCQSLLLPSHAQTRLRSLSPSPERWPSQIDRLGLWMGQSGVGTLSRTYWHGAWWVAGDICAQVALQHAWRSDTMGLLLGVSASAVRHHFPKRQDGKRATDGTRTAAAVAKFIGALDVRELTVAPVQVESQVDAASQEAGVRPVASVLDALLMQRRARGEELNVLHEVAAETLSVPPEEAKAFFAAYEDVGSRTSMQDFEPDALRVEPFAGMDVQGGADRRDRLVATVLEAMASDMAFAKATFEILSDWQTEVDGEAHRPYLVSRNIQQLGRHIKWLKTVGYDATELRLNYFAASADTLEDARKILPSLEESPRRLSRAAKIGARTEFGVVVAASRQLPVERDLHRAILGLACAHSAGLLAAASQ